MKLFKQAQRYGAKVVAVLATGVGAISAHAAGTAVDVTSVTDTISAQLTPIGLVGAAVLGVVVAIKAYKWVRRAM